MKIELCAFWIEFSMKKLSIPSTLTFAVQCVILNSQSKKIQLSNFEITFYFRNMIFCPVPGRIIGPSPV